MSKIPVTSSHVNITGLHPRFRQRLEAFFADPRIKGKVAVVSGTRTYAQQKRLYDGWVAKRPGYNLAANPDRKSARTGFQGSYHMSQPAFGNWGYAVDFRIVGRISTGEVNKIAAEYGIVKTVPSEWWHHCPCRVSGGKMEWFPVKGKEPAHAQNTKNELTGLAKLIDDCTKTVVRLGDTGIVVKVLQQFLVSNGHKLTNRTKERSGIDGQFGKRTLKAVKKFQRDEGLGADGVVGPKTWAALLD